jgi:hypothetical protein
VRPGAGTPFRQTRRFRPRINLGAGAAEIGPNLSLVLEAQGFQFLQ